MQFLAALFEHFIVGIFTIFCFAVFSIKGVSSADFTSCETNLGQIKELVVILILPISYLIGIYVDAVSSIFFKFMSLIFSKVKYPAKLKTVWGIVVKKIKLFVAQIFDGNSYKRTIEILHEEELSRYFLQLNSRLKVSRGVVPILIISFTYSFWNFGFFDKYSLIALLLSILSTLTYLWHDYLMETFKINFKAFKIKKQNLPVL